MSVSQLDFSIKNSKNILLVSHINPDGDTLGSLCAMYLFIKNNYKKESDMVAVSDIPVTYEFVPNIEKIKSIQDMDLSREYDLVINLDVAALDRCADAQILFNKAKKNVNIDHHETNIGYADINIIQPHSAATAEVLVDIANQLDWQITKDAAICLYVGIMTDTGCFKFSNTTQRTMEFAGKLLSYGVNSSQIYQSCYESASKNLTLFQSYCVGKAQFEFDDRVAYTVAYKKDLEKFKNDGEDFTDGLTEKLRAIKTTEIAFVVKELSNNLSKVSMRSKAKDIAKICSIFDGGGHKLAAGRVIKANPESAVKLLLEEIRKEYL